MNGASQQKPNQGTKAGKTISKTNYSSEITDSKVSQLTAQSSPLFPAQGSLLSLTFAPSKNEVNRT